MKKYFKFILPGVLIVLVIVLFRTVFLIGYVPTASMEPTLKEGSIILGIRTYSELRVGDIIVFQHNDNILVKRIAAVGGEQIVVDGKKYIVPEDNYFMLGDNADNSVDSRYWPYPYLSKKNVLAKLIK